MPKVFQTMDFNLRSTQQLLICFVWGKIRCSWFQYLVSVLRITFHYFLLLISISETLYLHECYNRFFIFSNLISEENFTFKVAQKCQVSYSFQENYFFSM